MDRETVGRVREQSALWEDDELVALCDALLEAWDENDRKDDIVRHALDALGADPVRVLRWLEGLPCQTCGGSGWVTLHCERTPDGGIDQLSKGCSACGGSGILGRDGVDKLRGFEQVGWWNAYEHELVVDDELHPTEGYLLKAEEVRPIVGPFNENARCEKCGGDDIFTRFVEATEACPTGAR